MFYHAGTAPKTLLSLVLGVLLAVSAMVAMLIRVIWR